MSDRVMLLIDADNVSVAVVEQAVERLLAEYGALHVRRAYCTAEGAVKHQQLFKRLLIKPMVNLAAGKNSTDIALAVDALDLVLAERPEVVVIASSDSDFAPLVSRLREKGCRVRGFGQRGKTGDETQTVYDQFDDLEHRPAAADGADAPAAPARRSTAVRKVASKKVAAKKVAAKAASKTVAKKTVAKRAAAKKTATVVDAVGAVDAVDASPPATGRRTPARRTRGRGNSTADRPETTPGDVPAAAPTAPASTVATPAPATMPAEVAALFRALPGLARGELMGLQRAAEQLRKAGQLSRSSSARKMFQKHPSWFDLQPPGDPKNVSALRLPQA